MQNEKSKVIASVQMAAVSNISHLTNDRIEALAGGHGMVNIAIHSVANVICEQLIKGEKLSIEFVDKRRLPIDDIILKSVEAAKASGADGANAALITACLMYLAGSAAQVGIPAGNRKLGATARMMAGVDRSGVAAIPTAKMNNKISALPAVLALYEAMRNGKLSTLDGRRLPINVGGGPLYGHSALGEDYVWPELAVNGAKIATQAMLDTMAGAVMKPHPFTSAVLGSAAILEIIHPDAEVPEGKGTYGRTTSVYLVGKSAAETAGLPEKLHFKVTGVEVDTAKIVGDVGLILKDIGAPSVIGMMAFDEIFACFQEGLSGFSGSPVNPPLGHIGGYTVAGMHALIHNKGDFEKTKLALREDRASCSFDPEVALISINTIARKANEIYRGPVTEMLVEATEPQRAKAIYDRCEVSYDKLSKGMSLEQVVKEMNDEHVHKVEQNAGKLFSMMMGEDISFKVTKLEPAARRTCKVVQKYWSFDPNIDITVKMGNKTADLTGFVHKILPEFMHGEHDDLDWALPLAAGVIDELSLNNCSILDVVIPTAVAAAMGINAPDEAAKIAESSAYLSRAIPGCKMHAKAVAELAVDIMHY